MKQAGNKVLSIVGSQTKELMILEDEMRDTSDELFLMTDDGSYGEKGFVTTKLQELIDAAGGLMFQISNSPDPADLQKIAGQLAASIAATVASGSTVPMAAGPTSNV